MRTLFYIILCVAAPAFLKAQTISGSWFGRADVDLAGLYNNYLTELVIKQKGTRVDGIFAYYFRDKYQSYFIHGTYNPRTREIIILNLPVIYYGSNSTVNSIDCMTNFRGVLITSRMGSKLMGTFYHDGKYKYMCPDLKVSYSLDRADKSQDSIAQMAARARIWKPQADDYVVDEVKAPGTPADTSTATVAHPADSANLHRPVTAPPPPPPDSAAVASSRQKTTDSVKLTESFGRRKAVLNRELLVESDSIRLSFYDNGEIDGDSISVFVNNQLVLSHQGLEAKAFNIYLHLDSTRDLTEISMFAENLGRLPPNTALMVVTDGVNRYEVFLSSSLTENATVELRRKRQ
ncbi:MAG TPA: hypothetical protein VFE32_17685 [Puia sp.]|jgi:hypothetical protein|nr:hypothetical protein [Puia sp.]